MNKNVVSRLVGMGLAAIACGGVVPAAIANTATPWNRPQPLQLSELSPMTHSEPSLTNTVWQLQQIQYNDGTLVEATPESYTIEFLEDGRLAIRADCNRALGSFTEDGSSVSITLGPTTLAACPPESIEQEYLRNLQDAAIYFFQDGDLFIDIKYDAGTMRFSSR